MLLSTLLMVLEGSWKLFYWHLVVTNLGLLRNTLTIMPTTTIGDSELFSTGTNHHKGTGR